MHSLFTGCAHTWAQNPRSQRIAALLAPNDQILQLSFKSPHTYRRAGGRNAPLLAVVLSGDESGSPISCPIVTIDILSRSEVHISMNSLLTAYLDYDNPALYYIGKPGKSLRGFFCKLLRKY